MGNKSLDKISNRYLPMIREKRQQKEETGKDVGPANNARHLKQKKVKNYFSSVFDKSRE